MTTSEIEALARQNRSTILANRTLSQAEIDLLADAAVQCSRALDEALVSIHANHAGYKGRNWREHFLERAKRDG